MSRADSAGPDGSTDTGSINARPPAFADGTSLSPPSLHGSHSGASPSLRRSSGRCQRPWRPRRVPAEGASKRIAPRRGHSRAAGGLEGTIAVGGPSPNRASAVAAATRAARAQARSVSISVRVGAGGLAVASTTLAPARCSESCNCRSATRSPSVEPSETISTWGRGAGGISADGVADALRPSGLEPGGAHQLHRSHGRGAAHVEARAVALLDRLHRSVLPAPGERPDDREAG